MLPLARGTPPNARSPGGRCIWVAFPSDAGALQGPRCTPGGTASNLCYSYFSYSRSFFSLLTPLGDEVAQFGSGSSATAIPGALLLRVE